MNLININLIVGQSVSGLEYLAMKTKHQIEYLKMARINGSWSGIVKCSCGKSAKHELNKNGVFTLRPIGSFIKNHGKGESDE
jgi:hypothetical protein